MSVRTETLYNRCSTNYYQITEEYNIIMDQTCNLQQFKCNNALTLHKMFHHSTHYDFSIAKGHDRCVYRRDMNRKSITQSLR